MFNFQRKDLTDNQFTRANKLTSASITLVYILFLVLNFTSDNMVMKWKLICAGIYVVWYFLTAFNIKRFASGRTAMLLLAIGFELSYCLLIFTTKIASIFLIFPVLLTITVYLNEVIFLWGCLGSLVLILIKSTMVRFSGTATASDYSAINVVLMGIVICLFGGFKAIKLLINFSNEETDAVKELLSKQQEIADEVESVSEVISADFDDVLNDLGSINETVSCTITSMNEIAKGSEQTASSASEQASMTNEIQNRLEATSQIAESAKNTSDELRQSIIDGRNQSNELEKQSQIVDEYTALISSTINELVENVAKVSNITSTILNISSQTNLLALNASIEAARAGEAGKGFAVVADEIRNLAEETKNSTEMITGIMAELTAVTEKAQTAVTKSVESIEIQREKIALVNNSFTVVDDGVEELSTGVNRMNEEVVAVLNANNKIVSNIDTLAAISEEMSSNAIQSADDSNLLADNMQKFTNVINQTSEKINELRKIVTE